MIKEAEEGFRDSAFSSRKLEAPAECIQMEAPANERVEVFQDRRLFVSGLLPETSEADLTALIGRFGTHFLCSFFFEAYFDLNVLNLPSGVVEKVELIRDNKGPPTKFRDLSDLII